MEGGKCCWRFGGSAQNGGIFEGGRGNERADDKLSEKERDLQLCLEENEKNTEKKLDKQKKLLLINKKKKVINLSLQNLTSGNSELGGGGESELEIMATLKPGGDNGGQGEEDRRRSMEFLLDTDKDKNAHLRVSFN